MSMEEYLCKLKFTKKEDPRELLLKIAKVIMRYKCSLPDSKKAAPILRLQQPHYADVLAAEKRACCQLEKQACTPKDLLECMSETWILSGGSIDESASKTDDELVLENLTSLVKKGHECWNYDKKGHKKHECKEENKRISQNTGGG